LPYGSNVFCFLENIKIAYTTNKKLTNRSAAAIDVENALATTKKGGFLRIFVCVEIVINFAM
jgi:hypothetical protein